MLTFLILKKKKLKQTAMTRFTTQRMTPYEMGLQQ